MKNSYKGLALKVHHWIGEKEKEIEMGYKAFMHILGTKMNEQWDFVLWVTSEQSQVTVFSWRVGFGVKEIGVSKVILIKITVILLLYYERLQLLPLSLYKRL